MAQKSASDPSELMDRVARLVVKEGVTLGNLGESDRSLALAWVWAGLPADAVLDEPGVNARLEQALQGAARCLNTDHVELRRWLVDGGWLCRDGYGRSYQRVAAAALPEHQMALGMALDGVDTVACVERLLLERGAARQARHAAWQAACQTRSQAAA
jgi:hypothetical protein